MLRLKRLISAKGALLLMPQQEDDWLLGQDNSDWFRRSKWKRKRQNQTRKEEALKALTATILDYGPQGVIISEKVKPRHCFSYFGG